MYKYLVALLFLFSLSTVKAHSITVDGDPSDWVGIGADTAVVDSGEWIVEDAIGDDWGDGGDAPNAMDNPAPYSYPDSVALSSADIEEFRLTLKIGPGKDNSDSLYGLVRMQDLTENSIVTILLAVDTTNVSYVTYDSSDIATGVGWNIMIVLKDGQILLFIPGGYPVNIGQICAFNYSNDVVEFGIPLDSFPEPSGDIIKVAVYSGVSTGNLYAEVDSLSSTTNGGGGTNTESDPDVYDIIAPDSASQTNCLSSYQDNSPATLPQSLFYSISLPQLLPFIPASIEEIQGHQSSSPFEGMTVMTWGVVTAVFNYGFFLEDVDSVPEPWNGIFVYTGSTPSVERGYSIDIIATVHEYNGLTELSNIDTIIVNDTGNYISPVLLPTGSVGDEQWEGMLVEVDSAVCTNPNLGYGEWEVDDGSGPIRIDDMGYSYNPDSGHLYRVVGPVTYTYGHFKIEPRDSNDVTELTQITPPTGLIINEVYYDAPGSDHGTFTEIIGPPNQSLDGVYLIGINGSNGQVYRTIDLSGHSINQNGRFVVAQDNTVPNADMVTNDVDWQNGPDNVVLAFISGNDTLVLDAVGYGSEDTTTWHFYGELIPTVDARSGYSISRIPDGNDTNCNVCDFAPMPPTPGDMNGSLLFSDGFENGGGNWSGDWGVTGQTSHLGNYSYTDSPNGNYPNNANLIGELNQSIDLSAFSGAYLQFYDAYWIEQGFDFGYVEVSTDSGSTWTTVKTVSGDNSQWTFENVDLGQFCGYPDVRIRFRLTSDAGYTEDGWFIDDVKIIGTSVDVSPPFIMHTPIPDTSSILDSVIVSATYMDASGISTDSLYYTIDASSNHVTSDSVSGNTYYYTIRGLTPGAFLSYYFVAIDNSGNRAQSAEYRHIAGNILYRDDDNPGYITLPDPGDSLAVRFDSIPADSVWITTLLYNFYMDGNHGLDSVSVHVWDSLGNDMIQPRTIYPVNTPDNPFAWTPLDIRDENLYIPGNTPFYVGVVFQDTIPALMLDSPGSFNSSYRFASGEWHLLGVDLFIRAIAGIYGTGISENSGNPLSFKLLQNVPNPVKQRTTISFILPHADRVRLSIYDVSGRLVKTVANGRFSEGKHSIVVNTNGLRNGVYFYELRTSERIATRKMLILK